MAQLGRQLNGEIDNLQIQTSPGYYPQGSPDDPLIVEDLEPQRRDRCNTWPLQRPEIEISDHCSPLIREEISEEYETGSEIGLQGSSENLVSTLHPQSAVGRYSPSTASPPGGSLPPALPGDDYSPGSAASKKTTSRRNAWGNMSYADLITQAIMSSPEKRLTLSQVYDWMVQNVPYFRDKGDSNSSAGWKNSIRHNLSLHSRFMRIQNEGAGKSSWWVINPDAKPGKASRRRAQTIETGSKSLEKKRGRVRKKVEAMRAAAAFEGGPGSEGVAVLDDSDFFDVTQAMRDRSNSNLSNYSTPINRLSPSVEDLEFSWALNPNAQPEPLIPSEILDMTGNMRLVEQQQQCLDVKPTLGQPPPYHSPETQRQHPQYQGSPVLSNGGMSNGPNSVLHHPSPTKLDINRTIKLEPGTVCAPPAYQELYPTTVNRLQNPMLRDALQTQPQPYMAYAPQQMHGHPSQFNHMGAAMPQASNGLLPSDISDISYDNWQQQMDVQCDIDAVLRHELSVAGQIDFNMDTM